MALDEPNTVPALSAPDLSATESCHNQDEIITGSSERKESAATQKESEPICFLDNLPPVPEGKVLYEAEVELEIVDDKHLPLSLPEIDTESEEARELIRFLDDLPPVVQGEVLFEFKVKIVNVEKRDSSH